MAETRELSLSVRLFLKTYSWRRIDPVPFAPLARPLAQCRLALLSSAGFTRPDQEPFDDDIRGGDTSFRPIPVDTEVATLAESHRSQSYDHSGLAADPNLAFPLDRLRELVAAGRIGSLAPVHFSFMGSITAPGRLIRRTAPPVADRLQADGVEAALLVPV
jgi:D-proline reductase (dithiol) PrdB